MASIGSSSPFPNGVAAILIPPGAAANDLNSEITLRGGEDGGVSAVVAAVREGRRGVEVLEMRLG